MRHPHVDDRVRLTKGVPNTSLAPGQVGVICSTWSAASPTLYEIEFAGRDDVTRRLCTREEFDLDEERAEAAAAVVATSGGHVDTVHH